jgi:hypothetical protein
MTNNNFTITPRTVRLLAGLSGITQSVALWHAVHANRRGICRDTYDKISFQLDCSVRQVQRAEATLAAEELGKPIIRNGTRVGFDASPLTKDKVDKSVIKKMKKAVNNTGDL